jgi:hypothetical protein
MKNKNDNNATDNDPSSQYESFKIKMNVEKDSTPFSKKRVCRESDTQHNKDNEGNKFQFNFN